VKYKASWLGKNDQVERIGYELKFKAEAYSYKFAWRAE
jgi:hypothetical protein